MIRKQSRWWVLTLLILALLMTLSALALNRPNVVWSGHKAHCPSCRFQVVSFSSRCAKCQTEYDWAEAPEELSPLCEYCLSALEDGYIRDSVARLSEPTVIKRFAEALQINPEMAKEVVGRVGRGRCGYCAGTGKQLGGATSSKEESKPCPICLGSTKCASCEGDRRVRLGWKAAYDALVEYRRSVEDISGQLPQSSQLAEYTRLARAFLSQYAGTREAAEIDVPLLDEDGKLGDPLRAVQAARDRLSTLMESLEPDEETGGERSHAGTSDDGASKDGARDEDPSGDESDG